MHVNKHIIGGIRFEAQPRCTFDCVANIWFKYKPYKLESFVSPSTITVRAMSTSDFVEV